MQQEIKIPEERYLQLIRQSEQYFKLKKSLINRIILNAPHEIINSIIANKNFFDADDNMKTLETYINSVLATYDHSDGYCNDVRKHGESVVWWTQNGNIDISENIKSLFNK